MKFESEKDANRATVGALCWLRKLDAEGLVNVHVGLPSGIVISASQSEEQTANADVGRRDIPY